MSTTTATPSKQLTKKELKKFQELLEEKRKAVLDRAREMLSVENMALDTNDLPDEMDLASSEYLQSFEFRLRGREKSLLSKLDLALKKIDGRHVRRLRDLRGADRQEAARGAPRDHALHQVQGRPGARRAHDGLSRPGAGSSVVPCTMRVAWGAVVGAARAVCATNSRWSFRSTCNAGGAASVQCSRAHLATAP